MKKEKKYVTLNDEGIDFRTMAEIMSKKGHIMNHATARNQLILAIQSFVGQMSQSLDVQVSREHIKNLISSQDLHENLSDVLYLAYKELKQEGEI